MNKRKTEESYGVFFNRLSRQIYNWLEREGLEATPENVLRFLCERNLIPAKEAVYWTAIQLYGEIFYQTEGRRMETLDRLEDIVPLSSKRLWWVTRNYTGRYRKSRCLKSAQKRSNEEGNT